VPSGVVEITPEPAAAMHQAAATPQRLL